jgi:hypothetical protein
VFDFSTKEHGGNICSSPSTPFSKIINFNLLAFSYCYDNVRILLGCMGRYGIREHFLLDICHMLWQMSSIFRTNFVQNKDLSMSVFKKEIETKRVIFNVRLDLAERLESAKSEARSLGKKLDTDTVIDKALEKFLKKAEKKMAEMRKKEGTAKPASDQEVPTADSEPDGPESPNMKEEDK